MASEIMEIVKGVAQVMANTYDGAVDDKGQPINAGLRRENVPHFTSCDCRLLDGFRARVGSYTDSEKSFPCLTLTYQSELKLEEVHSDKLEDMVGEHISEALKYLKKEYKKVTGKELNVKMHGELKILTEQLSKVKNFVTAVCHYEIKGVEFPKLEDEKEEARAAEFNKWLALGGLKK